ncbi:inositol 1,4,5-triphosphate receptor associated 1 isoform X6 [Stegostoma tigrinum]|uniref:inositol 1,4,5-triphosphate receptor associated 1 isoform X6 n=1 Tax=Stegostoma tigrinum TaxID=3053191 RepID=UPI00286FC216|nr:inositol 1,4,5-triphosphate receptor associated 1 isoform X6 [Stegostoma tigrinum]
MAEERLLAILASAKRAMKKINFPAGNATEGIRKQETDVWLISQEIFAHLEPQSISIYSGLYSYHGGWKLHASLLDALNLEHPSSCQSFGKLQGLRQLSLGQSQLLGEKHTSSKELLTEDRKTQKTSSSTDRASQEVVEEQRLSPESEARPAAPAVSEGEDYTPCSSLRTFLSQFVLPGADPSCPSLSCLTRSPHCIVAPTMPTLPEEEEGSEDQERMQSSSSSVLGSDPRMSETPAIVLPDITSSPDRELDQSSQIRSHSPIQRRSSRNSRTSFSSTSSLTSVDGDGHIYDLVNDKLPEVQLSDEDKKKNAELLDEAKKISERFLTRRCRRSRNSTSDSPPALTPSRTPLASPSPSRSNSVTIQPQIDPCAANSVGRTVVTSTQAGEKPPPTSNKEKEMKENKMMRNQNLSALRLPDLSETIEQDRGPSPTPCPAAEGSKGNSDITPNIPDSLLRKLKVHRSLPGGLPPLTEKEVENTFIQLSLAFKNDSYTLEARLGLAERERNLAEENTEKELENFKAEMKSSTSLWIHSDQRDAQQRLLETITVLQRLAVRLSGRAEMVGAVRQEKRMSKATEVMMQYVENLKRMYEKDHAELTEFKKLANQNSNRTYGPYGDSSDDGVPRTARSMSLTLGKTVPRRRVSVAVVPKFINFPGQPAIVTVAEPNSNGGSSNPATSNTTSPSSSSTMNVCNSSGINMYSSPTLAPLIEHGKQNGDKENECPTPGKVQPVKVEITSSETKARIEEEAYNKGYQEGLKAQLSQEQKELHDIPEKVEEHNMEKQPELNFKEERKCSKFEEVSELIDRLCPKCLRHRSAVWIVGAVVLFFAVLISIFSSAHYPCSDLSDTPSRKGSCSAVQKYLWPFSGSRHKNREQV